MCAHQRAGSLKECLIVFGAWECGDWGAQLAFIYSCLNLHVVQLPLFFLPLKTTEVGFLVAKVQT